MSGAITKAQPSAEFNGDWLLREVRFNAQGAVVDWRLPAQPAQSPQAPGRRKGPPGITLEPQGHEQPAAPVVSDEQIIDKIIQAGFTYHTTQRTMDEMRADIRAILAMRPAGTLTGCNCRWDGETQIEWCELHLAHKDAIHDWAERAKSAEQKLAMRPAVEPMTELHPLMIFARECELGTYMEHEVPLAARKAIAASQKRG